MNERDYSYGSAAMITLKRINFVYLPYKFNQLIQYWMKSFLFIAIIFKYIVLFTFKNVKYNTLKI